MRVLENWVNNVISNFNIYYKDKTMLLQEFFMLLLFKKKKGKSFKKKSTQNVFISGF